MFTQSIQGTDSALSAILLEGIFFSPFCQSKWRFNSHSERCAFPQQSHRHEHESVIARSTREQSWLKGDFPDVQCEE
jgi:hypothetical protein